MGILVQPLTCADAIALAARRSAAEPNSGCWLWAGSTDGGGYAKIGRRGRAISLPRAILGLLASGRSLQALHRCDVATCVNPAHLFVGTARDNNHDMMLKGRNRRVRATSLDALTTNVQCPRCLCRSEWRAVGRGRTRVCRPCHLAYRRAVRAKRWAA